MVRQAGANVTFEDSKLTVLGETMPALCIGNIIATTSIISSQINNTASNILAVVNYSQVTPGLDFFAGYPENSMLMPSEATKTVGDSLVAGSFMA